MTRGPNSANAVTVFLETRAHADMIDLDDHMASELGVLSTRLVRAIERLPGVGRAHVHRWADGAAHFHMWFVGRPARRIELYGWGDALWSQLLPPLPEADFERNLAAIADDLTRRR